MKGRRITRGFKIMLMVFVAVSVFGFVVMQLWNWLMPAIFGWHAVSFGQALGLLILSKILFGGFRGHAGRGGWNWRRRMAERYDQMTPAERENFRQGLQPRCGTPVRESMNL